MLCWGGGKRGLTISLAFLTRLPRKPPLVRVGEAAGSRLDVFSSQPPSPIRVLDAFLTVGPPPCCGRKGARGVYASSAPLEASSMTTCCSTTSDALSEPRAEVFVSLKAVSVYAWRMLRCLGSLSFWMRSGLMQDGYRLPAESWE